MFYGRYRYGTLTIEASKEPIDGVYQAIRRTRVWGSAVGHEYDGVMSQVEFKSYLRLSEFKLQLGYTGTV